MEVKERIVLLESALNLGKLYSAVLASEVAKDAGEDQAAEEYSRRAYKWRNRLQQLCINDDAVLFGESTYARAIQAMGRAALLIGADIPTERIAKMADAMTCDHERNDMMSIPGGGCYVQCRDCLAAGPVCETSKLAWEGWLDRPADSVRLMGSIQGSGFMGRLDLGWREADRRHHEVGAIAIVTRAQDGPWELAATTATYDGELPEASAQRCARSMYGAPCWELELSSPAEE